MIYSTAWLSALFFISIRIGIVLLFTPIQAIRQLPIAVRIVFIFSLSLLLVQYTSHTPPSDDVSLYLSGIMECVNGSILALLISICFASIQIAGHLIEQSIGLNTLGIFNPVEHQEDSVSGHLLMMLTVLFFFGMDGHVWLFQALTYSFSVIPPGSLAVFSSTKSVIQSCGLMFMMAFMIASPIIIAMLILDLCGAVITRSMPQSNPYFLVLPLKIILGFIMLMLMMNYISPLTRMLFDSLFQSWQELMS